MSRDTEVKLNIIAESKESYQTVKRFSVLPCNEISKYTTVNKETNKQCLKDYAVNKQDETDLPLTKLIPSNFTIHADLIELNKLAASKKINNYSAGDKRKLQEFKNDNKLQKAKLLPKNGRNAECLLDAEKKHDLDTSRNLVSDLEKGNKKQLLDGDSSLFVNGQIHNLPDDRAIHSVLNNGVKGEINHGELVHQFKANGDNRVHNVQRDADSRAIQNNEEKYRTLSKSSENICNLYPVTFKKEQEWSTVKDLEEQEKIKYTKMQMKRISQLDSSQRILFENCKLDSFQAYAALRHQQKAKHEKQVLETANKLSQGTIRNRLKNRRKRGDIQTGHISVQDQIHNEKRNLQYKNSAFQDLQYKKPATQSLHYSNSALQNLQHTKACQASQYNPKSTSPNFLKATYCNVHNCPSHRNCISHQQNIDVLTKDIEHLNKLKEHLISSSIYKHVKEEVYKHLNLDVMYDKLQALEGYYNELYENIIMIDAFQKNKQQCSEHALSPYHKQNNNATTLKHSSSRPNLFSRVQNDDFKPSLTSLRVIRNESPVGSYSEDIEESPYDKYMKKSTEIYNREIGDKGRLQEDASHRYNLMKNPKRLCSVCKKDTQLFCSACQNAYYCSMDCQVCTHIQMNT